MRTACLSGCFWARKDDGWLWHENKVERQNAPLFLRKIFGTELSIYNTGDGLLIPSNLYGSNKSQHNEILCFHIVSTDSIIISVLQWVHLSGAEDLFTTCF